MKQALLPLGVLLVFLGITLITIHGFTGQNGDTKVAVGGFIGPVPFGFGNSPGMVKLAIVLSFAALAIFIIISRFL